VAGVYRTSWLSWMMGSRTASTISIHHQTHDHNEQGLQQRDQLHGAALDFGAELAGCAFQHHR